MRRALSLVGALRVPRRALSSSSSEPPSVLDEMSPLERMMRVRPMMSKLDDLKHSRLIDDGLDGDSYEDGDVIEVDPRDHLGKFVLRNSRVAYRSVDRDSEEIDQKLRKISKGRTTAQLRRCLGQWMIDSKREDQVKFAQKSIKGGWDNPVPAAASVPVYAPTDTIAYTHFLFKSRLAVNRRVLRDLQTILPDFRPTSMVDFGCGPGSAMYAAMEAFDSLQTVQGVDLSQSMIDAARIMTEGMSPNITFKTKLSDVLNQAATRKQRYSLTVASYVLTELASDNARKAAVQALYELLDDNGCMVLIERGNPEGSHAVRTARQLILDVYGDVQESRPQTSTRRPTVVAPCPHDKECPLQPGAWCSFAQMAHSSVIRMGNLEKFSYVVIRKVPRSDYVDSTAPPELDPSAFSPLDVLNRYFKAASERAADNISDDLAENVDWENYKPQHLRGQWSRILRTPNKANHHITFDLCTPKGTMEQLTVSKAQFARIPDGYNALRKTSWGGLFPAIQASTIAERARVTKKNKRALAARERALLEADKQQAKPKSEIAEDVVEEEEVVAASRTTAATAGRTSSRLRLRDLVRQQRTQAARSARLARQAALEEDRE